MDRDDQIGIQRRSLRWWLAGLLFVAIAASCATEETPDTTELPTTTTVAEIPTTSPETTTTGAATVTTIPAEPGYVVLTSPDPVVDVANYNGSGAVAAVDGGYVMLSNQYLSWPPSVEVKLFTSTDGVIWAPEGDQVVLDFEAAGAPPASIANSVVVEPDGSLTMFFYSYEGALASTAVSFGRATAPAASGPWTVDPQPVFTVGEGWDSGTISTPTVIRTESGYVMFYTGGTGDGVTSIGRAESSDGIEWTRLDEPVFTASGVEGTWDEHRVSQPNLFFTSSGLVMLFKGNSIGSLGRDHGLACADSLEADAEWERIGDEAILSPDIVLGGDMIFSTESFRVGGQAALLITVSRDPNATSTEVYQAFLPIVDRLEQEGIC